VPSAVTVGNPCGGIDPGPGLASEMRRSFARVLGLLWGRLDSNCVQVAINSAAAVAGRQATEILREFASVSLLTHYVFGFPSRERPAFVTRNKRTVHSQLAR
jgi:hypothetical protein